MILRRLAQRMSSRKALSYVGVSKGMLCKESGSPRADPANNESERMLRKAVTAGRIRFRIQHGGRPGVPKHNDLRADVEESEPQRVGYAAEGFE